MICWLIVLIRLPLAKLKSRRNSLRENFSCDSEAFFLKPLVDKHLCLTGRFFAVFSGIHRCVYGSPMKMKMTILGLMTMIGSSECCRGPFLNAFGKAKTMA